MMKVFALLLLLAMTVTNTVYAKQVVIVLSNQSEIYTQISQTLTSQIHQQSKQIMAEVVPLSSFRAKNVSKQTLIIAVGNKATEQIQNLNLENNIIYSFSKPQSLPTTPGRWAATVTAQPIIRLVEAARTLYRSKRMVLAVSNDNHYVLEQLDQLPASIRKNLDIITLSNTDKPAKLIEKHLYNTGALIATYDNHIWQGENARWMLYQAYQHKVPVIGFSKKFLKAGALVSVYSNITQIAKSTVSLVINWAQNDSLNKSGIIYSDYHIEYNESIARALNISLPAHDSQGEIEP